MRDKTIIRDIAKEIVHIQNKYPDIRVGEIIDNALGSTNRLAYVDDEKLLELICEFGKKEYVRDTYETLNKQIYDISKNTNYNV